VLNQGHDGTYITPLPVKLDLLESMGFDAVYVFKFDRTLAALPPNVFVAEVLAKLNVKHVVVGFDFTFGHRGLGTAETLTELADERFGVSVVPPVFMNGEKVSSTLVRRRLLEGNVEAVRQLLNRCYSISGRVVKGEQRGRTLGFPTANLSLDAPFIIPKKGVYTVNVHCANGVFAGVMDIGNKPTFHQAFETTLEVHIIDRHLDLYDQVLTVDIHQYLRPDQKFNSVKQLIDQIRNDVEQAKIYFASL